jgi:Xaa-Pro aminopeptidase
MSIFRALALKNVPAAIAVAILAAAPSGASAQSAPPVRPSSAQSAPQPFVEDLPGMGRPIDTAATAARRARLMERLGGAVAIVPAARPRNFAERPQDTDFRQSVTFFWLTGLEQPQAFLVLAAHATGADTAVLLVPDRDLAQERWSGPKMGPGERAVQLTGVSLVLSVTKLDSVVLAAKARRVPVYLPFDRDAAGIPALDWLRADSPAVTTRNLRPITDSLRAVKDAAELATMRRAASITAAGHLAALRALRPGLMEYELEAEVEGTFHRLGADAVSFPSIIGSGFYSTVLHYMSNRRRMDEGDLVVVDVGSEVAGYGSDLTRTYPVSGRYTPRQRAIYELVLATQQTAIDSVRPGITLAQLNTIAREYLRTHSADLCGPESCLRYFIHGLSHHIGLGGEAAPQTRPLEPGMVVTVEPGIYIPEESLGVRIEDDVVVTPSGHEVTTAAAPKAVLDVERAMAEARRVPPRR